MTEKPEVLSLGALNETCPLYDLALEQVVRAFPIRIPEGTVHYVTPMTLRELMIGAWIMGFYQARGQGLDAPE